MSAVEGFVIALLLFFITFLLVHAVMYKMEETRAWNRKRILQRRAERDRKEAEDS
tara:strand:- start:16 stop:180 length:165 start_codon:yes stop_codon:yes gene_type:complete